MLTIHVNGTAKSEHLCLKDIDWDDSKDGLFSISAKDKPYIVNVDCSISSFNEAFKYIEKIDKLVKINRITIYNY